MKKKKRMMAPMTLPDDLHDWIDAKQEETGNSRNSIVRDSLRDSMDKDKRKERRKSI